jgi:hypothetical protein
MYMCSDFAHHMAMTAAGSLLPMSLIVMLLPAPSTAPATLAAVPMAWFLFQGSLPPNRNGGCDSTTTPTMDTTQPAAPRYLQCQQDMVANGKLP